MSFVHGFLGADPEAFDRATMLTSIATYIKQLSDYSRQLQNLLTSLDIDYEEKTIATGLFTGMTNAEDLNNDVLGKMVTILQDAITEAEKDYK